MISIPAMCEFYRVMAVWWNVKPSGCHITEYSDLLFPKQITSMTYLVPSNVLCIHGVGGRHHLDITEHLS